MWFKLSTTSAQDDYIESEKCSPPVQLLRNGLSESENYFALDELFDERLIEHFPNEVGRFVTLDGVLYFRMNSDFGYISM